jgi:DtxR family transcriptional regulator, manganese transport regulator
MSAVALKNPDLPLETAAFRLVRDQHASETAQDYVEAVADLIEEHGEARAVDLARKLGVTHVTVSQTVSRLQKSGLIQSQPYRSIFLTDEGRALAAQCKARHLVILDFLKRLGVSEEAAIRDAEGIEHHVSAETLAAMESFRS